MSFVLNELGNLCYRLNGGLDAIHNGSDIDRLAKWFWSQAYGFADEQCRAMKPIWLRWLR